MMEVQEVSYAFKINGQEISLKALNGYSSPRELACYHFKADTDYEIEITNLIPFPEYKGIQSFFSIVTVPGYQSGMNEEK